MDDTSLYVAAWLFGVMVLIMLVIISGGYGR